MQESYFSIVSFVGGAYFIVAMMALFSHLPGVQFLMSPVDMLGGGVFWAVAVMVLAIVGIVRNEPRKKLAYTALMFAAIFIPRKYPVASARGWSD